jgi:hypothetical protein
MNDHFDPFSLIAVIAIVVGLVKILGPVAHAIAHRALRGAEVSSDPAILTEIDTLKDRLAEVEERLDFSERLLANSHQAEPLPGRPRQ